VTVGVIIQARMGSTRLPGKVLKQLGDRPILGHILDRLGHLEYPATVVVATSLQPADDAIEQYCRGRDINCFRGSETDVLDRYLACASKYAFDQVVRLTADNPFTDITELDRLIQLHLKDDNDYTHSFGKMPVGVGAEIFSMAALRRSHQEGHAQNHREHVNEYIQENPLKFKIGMLEVPPGKQRPDMRLTVDTRDDFERAEKIVALGKGRQMTTEEAITACLLSA
jgi:spore coat polysaccharide biosynthesis protein SpsF